MIASTRLVNIGRTVMPYASWAAYAIQLGYVGYNLYHYYQEYLAQVERDQRSNTQRALNETIELVVAPRRRRDRQQQQQQQQQQTTTIQEQQPQEQQSQTQTQTQQEANVSVGATEERDQQRDAALLLVENNNDLHDTRESDQETSQAEQQQQQIQTPDRLSATTDVGRVEPPSGSSQIEVITIEDDDDDEILSDGDASISLESTDSNRGIINDMYSECFICARSLNDPNKQVATLPFCLHPFHKTCLDGVLQWHRKCPVCDFNIFSPI